MRIFSLIRWGIVGVLLTLLIAPAAITLATGTQLVVVDGKSMTPTYEFGDLVLIGHPSPDDFQPGHVVTVGRPDGSMYTHRIQEITDGKAVLKGDGNTSTDPDNIAYDQLVGAVRGHIGGPLAAVLSYAQTTPARISLAVLILALIFLPLERRSTSTNNSQDPDKQADDHLERQKATTVAAADETDRALQDIFGPTTHRDELTDAPTLPQGQHVFARRQSHR